MLKAATETPDTLHKMVQRQKYHPTSYQRKDGGQKTDSIFKVLKENYGQPRILYQNSIPLALKNFCQKMSFSDKWRIHHQQTCMVRIK